MSVLICSKFEVLPLQCCFLPLTEVNAVLSWRPNQTPLSARSSFLSGQWYKLSGYNAFWYQLHTFARWNHLLHYLLEPFTNDQKILVLFVRWQYYLASNEELIMLINSLCFHFTKSSIHGTIYMSFARRQHYFIYKSPSDTPWNLGNILPI